MLNTKPPIPNTNLSTQAEKISKTPSVLIEASPNNPKPMVPRSRKNKKARVKALLAALEELDFEESATEEEGTREPQTFPHSPNHCLARYSSPKKFAPGTSMNHTSMPPSYPRRGYGGSISSFYFSSHINSKGSGSSELEEMSS